MPGKDATAIRAHAAAEENASENLSSRGLPTFRQRFRQRLSKDFPSRIGCDFKRLSTSSSFSEGFWTAERTLSAKLSPQRMGLAVMRLSKTSSTFFTSMGAGVPGLFLPKWRLFFISSDIFQRLLQRCSCPEYPCFYGGYACFHRFRDFLVSQFLLFVEQYCSPLVFRELFECCVKDFFKF